MNVGDILKLLPGLHGMNNKKGYTRYQVLKILGLDIHRSNYRKLTEFAEIGFLIRVDTNPDETPLYIPDKDKIWNFWKNSKQGEDCKKMIEEHSVVLE